MPLTVVTNSTTPPTLRSVRECATVTKGVHLFAAGFCSLNQCSDCTRAKPAGNPWGGLRFEGSARSGRHDAGLADRDRVERTTEPGRRNQKPVVGCRRGQRPDVWDKGAAERVERSNKGMSRGGRTGHVGEPLTDAGVFE
jgi:hypothetical protein